MSREFGLFAYAASVALLLTDPEAPARIRRVQQAITDTLREHREHRTQLDSWENEGGTIRAESW